MKQLHYIQLLEVPGLLPAPALFKQENSNGGALTVGTSAVVTHTLSKRAAEAEADPALLYSSVAYNGYYPYAYGGLYGGYAGYPYGYAYYG